HDPKIAAQAKRIIEIKDGEILSDTKDGNFNPKIILKAMPKEKIKQEKLSNPNTLVKLKAFELRSLQCAFVMDEISNFVRAGIDP
ncbi:hypothetical protein VWN77_10535, partial [Campylobacter coli]